VVKNWANLSEVESGEKIKKYWQYILYEEMSVLNSKKCEIKMIKENLSLNDSFWFYIPFILNPIEESYKYFSYQTMTITETVSSALLEDKDSIVRIRFMSADEVLFKKRKVQTLVGFAEELGGFLDFAILFLMTI
jgi:hypothetical protein